jgi:DNA-binding SARP family transcriptional activator
VEFRVLGPVEVRDGPVAVALGGPKPQISLATLILHNGQTFPATRLIDAIWGESPPPSARTLVQSYVAGLRRALPSPDVIATVAPGYALRAGPDDIDLCRFENLVEQGRAGSLTSRRIAAGSPTPKATKWWSSVRHELAVG